jgi:hypothetical protein
LHQDTAAKTKPQQKVCGNSNNCYGRNQQIAAELPIG